VSKTRPRTCTTGCRDLGAEVVHFIDDDTEVAAGYFNAIERRLREDPDVMGVGGVIVNQPPLKYVRIKSFFMLLSRRPGAVLRSGRPTLGQYPGARRASRVEWLSGCSMSFRMAAFDEVAFDGRLQGYSLGEDYDFGFRLSRKHRLAIEPAATCIHHLTPTARGTMRAHARQRTCLTHRRVREYRQLGLSPTAFWWSVFGDFLTHAVHGVLRADVESLQEARGVLDGVLAVVSHEQRESARKASG
jgi:GT2 family glycosyltransferase